MKTILNEWYGPSSDELAEFYKNGTIALDANVLLSLYRVNGAQRNQILEVLGKIADRLWIPYQVAYEYQRNRLSVAWSVNADFDAIETMPEAVMQSVIESARASLGEYSSKAGKRVRDREIRNTIQRQFEDAQSDLIALAEKHQSKMKDEFKSIRSTHTIGFDDVKNNDPVRDALDSLIDESNTGRPPSAEVESARRADAKTRIENEVPPGYMDVKNKPDPSGDCLIWFELIEHAKTTKRRILFVTDDVKEDFYIKVHGRTIGPRSEMIAEMAKEAGQPYHQTTLDGFLRSANAFLDAEVTEETISTVRSAREYTNRVEISNAVLADAMESPISYAPTDLTSVEYDVFLALIRDIESRAEGNSDASMGVPALGLLGSATAAAESRGDVETLERVLELHTRLGASSSAIINTQVSIARVLLREKRPVDASIYLEGAYANARRTQSMRRFDLGRQLAEALIQSGRLEAGRRVLTDVLVEIDSAADGKGSLITGERRRSGELYRNIFGKEFPTSGHSG
ncbi:PIN-like domain-containing protein [Nocardia sp. NPDC049707]|uniref:PIN-like domain-containing protein n=1 Tax=Nocardia sp. NPDC049707 TaxID=3154735 RepID=UPI00344862A7